MRALKIAGAVLAALVALGVLAAVLVAALFDPNDYKSVVTDAFQARTGRTLALDQDLKLSVFPWLAVETGGVTIGNAAGFGGADGDAFATVERVAARVKLAPLLDRHIEVGTIELDGLNLRLARDAQGRGNWQDLVDAAAANGATPASPTDTTAPRVQSFALEGVRVRRGTVEWRENTTDLKYTIAALDLSTGAIGSGKPVRVEASLELRDELSGLAAKGRFAALAALDDHGGGARDLEMTATVTPPNAKPRTIELTAANVAFDRDQQTLRVEGLMAESAGVRATGQVAAAGLLTSPAFTGSVAVADAPLARVFEALELRPPTGVAPADLGNGSLTAKFAVKLEPRDIAISDLALDALGVRITGAGTLHGKDALSGSVVIPEFKPSPAVLAVLRTNVPPTVDVAALDKLAFAARFDANLTTGRAALHDLKATVLGGSFSGELEALPGERGNRFQGSLSTSRFAPDSFAKAFAKLLPSAIDAKKLGMVQVKMAKFAFDSGADIVTVAPFDAELFGLAGSGEITGRTVSKNATWSGSLRVAQFSPQDLIMRFGLPRQATSDPRAFTRATVTTHFEVDAKRGHFQDVVVALDDSKITGDFTLDGFNDPKYGFVLDIDSVDADRYLPPKARDAKAGQATAGDIELPAGNTMKLDGTVRVAQLGLAGLKFADVGARIVLGQGNAELTNARAKLYGGEFAGNFHVRAAGNEPGLALDGHASGLELTPLIAALTASQPNFSGVGTFDIDLAGKGRTVIDNVRTAAGKVNFAIHDGAIKGFNLGSTLCTVYNATQRVGGPRGEQPKQTSYQVMQGSATVADGVAHSNDLLARTSFMDVTGKGSLGLVEQKLDYDLEAKLTGRVAIPGCETMNGLVGESLPLDIKGTITDPKVTPDFSEIIKRRLKNEAKDRLTDRLLRGILK
jgi:uncharacterized protein involved in outer membrane biogenesis